MSTLLFSKKILTTTLFSICFLICQAHTDGHKIKGTVANFEGTHAFLAMLYGGNQYMVDTAQADNGSFTFESRYDLQSGVYLVILPPASSFLLLVDQNEREFTFTADAKNLENSLVFTGSKDNTAYYEYLKFFRDKKSKLDKIKAEYDAQKSDPDKVALLANMQQLKQDVVQHQAAVVAQYPGSLTAAMIRCELPVEPPAFDGSPEEINVKKYLFQKNHFFDNVDLNDERLIRAPKSVLVDRVEYYLDNLTMQQPDSINASVDRILKATQKTEVAYRFLLTHIFNKYREAKSIGMDAVYVHIAENYIAKDKAPWIPEDEKNAVLAAVKLISPTLIGKKAPDFTVQTAEGKNISLHGIQSPYTVLFFWAPNCTHCQQSIPTLSKFYDAYKSKGVEVFAVCTKTNEQEKNCWEYVDKNHLNSWINASDKMGGNSSIHTQYNLKTTPRIFVLNKDKTIIAKDLGVEHLEEVMKRLQL